MENDLLANPRFLVGIDLGTTNSALAYVDTEDPDRLIQNFRIPQIVAPGEWEHRDVLPSFLYLAFAGEFAAGALKTPWAEGNPLQVVGFFARQRGDQVPSRVVQSAKSWLCHSGVDRTSKLLPWHAAEDVERVSPVEASAAYLNHMRLAWNHAHPANPLEHQEVVLTLPASFDELARELTIAAAKQAGLQRIMLLEEPQAAFYAWLDRNAHDWQTLIGPGQKILVCDIGGGTSDFTLIRARGAEGGKVQFHRVAVGPHLMLGGDNLDLALAKHIEHRISPDAPLDATRWSQVLQRARPLKELFLGERSPIHQTVSLPSASSRLIGGAHQLEVTREEVERLLIDGFLPYCQLQDAPSARRSGFQEFGLPYAPDAAITKYLARFLLQHAHTGEDHSAHGVGDPMSATSTLLAARPDVVLLNGGFFASQALRVRLIEVLTHWFASVDSNWRPLVLDNPRLDLAVAQGAAYFARVRRGEGVSISSSLARSYYLGVRDGQGRTAAVCFAPGHIEPGQSLELEQPRFELKIRTPVEFPLFVSSTRLADRPGEILPIDPEQMTPLPPLRTVIASGAKSAGAAVIPVVLFGALTEIGVLELGFRELEGARRWRLQFDVRSAVQTDRQASETQGERQGLLEESQVLAALHGLRNVFGSSPSKEGAGHAAQVVKTLEQVLHSSRSAWPATLLRRMWEELMTLEGGRRKSAEHEMRWLYLVGYSLRPGFGIALDDWRVDQTRRLLWDKKLSFPAVSVQVEWLVLWRRIGAGLTAGQQRSLAEPLMNSASLLGKKASAKARESASLIAERIRLLGSLELLPSDWKRRMGDELLQRAPREESAALRDAAWWALGRLGAREPLTGPLNCVVPRELASRWLQALFPLHEPSPPLLLAAMQLARKTGDRFRDIDTGLRKEVLGWLQAHSAPSHYLELVSKEGALSSEDEEAVFGENLPLGLSIIG